MSYWGGYGLVSLCNWVFTEAYGTSGVDAHGWSPQWWLDWLLSTPDTLRKSVVRAAASNNDPRGGALQILWSSVGQQALHTVNAQGGVDMSPVGNLRSPYPAYVALTLQDPSPGAYKLPQDEVYVLCVQAVSWACKQMVNDNVSLSHLDLILHEMVEQRKMILWATPQVDGVSPTDPDLRAVWQAFLTGSGWKKIENDWQRYNSAAWQRAYDQSSGIEQQLEFALTVVNWASLREPWNMLERKVAELNDLRGKLHAYVRMMSNAEAAGILPESDRAHLARVRTELERAEGEASTVLAPLGMWQSGLGGLGALVQGITAGTLVAILGLVAVIVGALTYLIKDCNAVYAYEMNVKAIDRLYADEKQVLDDRRATTLQMPEGAEKQRLLLELEQDYKALAEKYQKKYDAAKKDYNASKPNLLDDMKQLLLLGIGGMVAVNLLKK